MVTIADLTSYLRLDASSFMTGVAAAETAVSGLQLKIQAAAGVVGLIADVTAVATAKAATDYQALTDHIHNNTQMTNADIAGMSSNIQTMASQSGAALDQLATGYMHASNLGYDLASSQQIVNQAMQASVATGSQLGATANLLAVTMRNFGASSDQAGTYMNTLLLIAQRGNMTLEEFSQASSKALQAGAQFGVTLQEVGAALDTMTQHGMSAAQSATAFENIIKDIAKPTQATEKEIAALAQLTGIDLVRDFSAAGLESRGFTQVQADIAAATSGSNQALLNMFPNIRALRGEISLAGLDFQGYKNNLQATTAAINGEAIPVQEAYARHMQTSGAQMEVLARNVQLLAIQLGSNLLPILNAVLAPLAAGVASMTAFAQAHSTLTTAALMLSVAFGTVAGGSFLLHTALSPLLYMFGGLERAAGRIIQTWPAFSSGARAAALSAQTVARAAEADAEAMDTATLARNANVAATAGLRDALRSVDTALVSTTTTTKTYAAAETDLGVVWAEEESKLAAQQAQRSAVNAVTTRSIDTTRAYIGVEDDLANVWAEESAVGSGLAAFRQSDAAAKLADAVATVELSGAEIIAADSTDILITAQIEAAATATAGAGALATLTAGLGAAAGAAGAFIAALGPIGWVTIGLTAVVAALTLASRGAHDNAAAERDAAQATAAHATAIDSEIAALRAQGVSEQNILLLKQQELGVDQEHLTATLEQIRATSGLITLLDNIQKMGTLSGAQLSQYNQLKATLRDLESTRDSLIAQIKAEETATNNLAAAQERQKRAAADAAQQALMESQADAQLAQEINLTGIAEARRSALEQQLETVVSRTAKSTVDRTKVELELANAQRIVALSGEEQAKQLDALTALAKSHDTTISSVAKDTLLLVTALQSGYTPAALEAAIATGSLDAALVGASKRASSVAEDLNAVITALNNGATATDAFQQALNRLVSQPTDKEQELKLAIDQIDISLDSMKAKLADTSAHDKTQAALEADISHYENAKKNLEDQAKALADARQYQADYAKAVSDTGPTLQDLQRIVNAFTTGAKIDISSLSTQGQAAMKQFEQANQTSVNNIATTTVTGLHNAAVNGTAQFAGGLNAGAPAAYAAGQNLAQNGANGALNTAPSFSGAGTTLGNDFSSALMGILNGAIASAFAAFNAAAAALGGAGVGGPPVVGAGNYAAGWAPPQIANAGTPVVQAGNFAMGWTPDPTGAATVAANNASQASDIAAKAQRDADAALAATRANPPAGGGGGGGRGHGGGGGGGPTGGGAPVTPAQDMNANVQAQRDLFQEQIDALNNLKQQVSSGLVVLSDADVAGLKSVRDTALQAAHDALPAYEAAVTQLNAVIAKGSAATRDELTAALDQVKITGDVVTKNDQIATAANDVVKESVNLIAAAEKKRHDALMSQATSEVDIAKAQATANDLMTSKADKDNRIITEQSVNLERTAANQKRDIAQQWNNAYLAGLQQQAIDNTYYQQAIGTADEERWKEQMDRDAEYVRFTGGMTQSLVGVWRDADSQVASDSDELARRQTANAKGVEAAMKTAAESTAALNKLLGIDQAMPYISVTKDMLASDTAQLNQLQAAAIQAQLNVQDMARQVSILQSKQGTADTAAGNTALKNSLDFLQGQFSALQTGASDAGKAYDAMKSRVSADMSALSKQQEDMKKLDVQSYIDGVDKKIKALKEQDNYEVAKNIATIRDLEGQLKSQQAAYTAQVQTAQAAAKILIDLQQKLLTAKTDADKQAVISEIEKQIGIINAANEAAQAVLGNVSALQQGIGDALTAAQEASQKAADAACGHADKVAACADTAASKLDQKLSNLSPLTAGNGTTLTSQFCVNDKVLASVTGRGLYNGQTMRAGLAECPVR